MTVAELLSRMGSRELTEWAAYFEVKNFRTQMDNAKQEGIP
jgi:hypothetical protein